MKRNALVKKNFQCFRFGYWNQILEGKNDLSPTKNEEISCFEWLNVFGRLEAVQAVLRIQNVYPGSRIRLFHSGSRIDKIPDPDPHQSKCY
jgi:hypothetical protein